jgi:Flp pilus assembly protein TadD
MEKDNKLIRDINSGVKKLKKIFQHYLVQQEIQEYIKNHTILIIIIFLLLIPWILHIFSILSKFIVPYYIALTLVAIIVQNNMSSNENQQDAKNEPKKILIILFSIIYIWTPIAISFYYNDLQSQQLKQMEERTEERDLLAMGLDHDFYEEGKNDSQNIGCALPESHPVNAEFNLAYCLYKVGGNKYAIKHMNKAANQENGILEHPEYWHNLGFMYNQLDNSKLAKKALQKAIDLGTGDEAVYCTLAKIYYEEGNSKKALNILNQAKKIVSGDQKVITYCEYMINKKLDISQKGFVEYYQQVTE